MENKLHIFEDCLASSLNKKTQDSFNQYYYEKWGNNIKSICRYDKDDTAQRTYGTDVVIILKDGNKITIDEKVRDYFAAKYGDILFETHHIFDNGNQKLGWVFTTHSDYIAYGWKNEFAFTLKDAMLIPMSDYLIHEFKIYKSTKNECDYKKARNLNYWSYNLPIPIRVVAEWSNPKSIPITLTKWI
jgi:hypothetical protein